jgi:hypothetical protein
LQTEWSPAQVMIDMWRTYRARVRFLEMKYAAILISKTVRGHFARTNIYLPKLRRHYARLMHAAENMYNFKKRCRGVAQSALRTKRTKRDHHSNHDRCENKSSNRAHSRQEKCVFVGDDDDDDDEEEEEEDMCDGSEMLEEDDEVVVTPEEEEEDDGVDVDDGVDEEDYDDSDEQGLSSSEYGQGEDNDLEVVNAGEPCILGEPIVLQNNQTKAMYVFTNSTTAADAIGVNVSSINRLTSGKKAALFEVFSLAAEGENGGKPIPGDGLDLSECKSMSADLLS